VGRRTVPGHPRQEQAGAQQQTLCTQAALETPAFQPHEVHHLQALGVPTHRAWVLDDSSSQSSMWRGGDDQLSAEDHRQRPLPAQHPGPPTSDMSDSSGSLGIATAMSSSSAAGGVNASGHRTGACREPEALRSLPAQSWAGEHAAVERRALARHVGLASVEVAVALYYARRLLSKCMRGLRAIMLAGRASARVARSR
jgi:hypothetical protein